MAAPSTGKEIYKDYPRSSRSMICPPSSSKAPVIIAGKKKMASVGIADAKLREDQSLCFVELWFPRRESELLPRRKALPQQICTLSSGDRAK
ncbi:hypothetical protein B296_00049428 [Ensete ventricosum]|uniref:Uncharacterized protein n=1 Tax=Ensete ventricosum TaxID=4639 RepID=A0A426YQS1_ENSVE|nr:hypothetical protein B296_00049428 [Ensete ventricosum]